MTTLSNLFDDIPSQFREELVTPLLDTGTVRIERIVSHGHASPPGFWYDQDHDEWVLVVKGAARLRFEGDESIEMKAGDYLDIPAHKKHRVEWTTPDEPTIWLTVHRASDGRVIPSSNARRVKVGFDWKLAARTRKASFPGSEPGNEGTTETRIALTVCL